MVHQLTVRNLLLFSKVVLKEVEVVVDDGAAADIEKSVAGQEGSVKEEKVVVEDGAAAESE